MKHTAPSHTLRRAAIATGLLSALLVTASFAISPAPTAEAQSGSMPITGYMWASPGSVTAPYGSWISFSGNTTDGGTYGVYEDTSGALTGYAWSSTDEDASNPGKPAGIGWIRFGVSDSTHDAAAIDLATGSAVGWARACAALADKASCSDAGGLDPNSNGWDGWISLSGAASDGTPYGIEQASDCSWSGYAWGSDAIGAISASGTATDGSPYGVTGNDPVACSGVFLTATPDTIASGQSSTLTWGSNGMTSCTGSGFNTGGATSGSTSTGSLTETTSYQVSCTNGSGSVPAIATVTVLVPQANTFTLSTNRVQRGTHTIDVNWDVSDANACDVYRNGTLIYSILVDAATHTASGTYSDTVDITGQTTYRLDCDGTTVATQIVNVVQNFQEF